MTDVCSGSAKPAEHGGAERGIATVWVEADSPERAIERGRDVMASRHYSRTGELTLFREETTHVESDAPIDPQEGPAARYIAKKTSALRETNGLFEIWFPLAWN